MHHLRAMVVSHGHTGVGSTYSTRWVNNYCSGGTAYETRAVSNEAACASLCSGNSACVAYQYYQYYQHYQHPRWIRNCTGYTTVLTEGSFSSRRDCAIKDCDTTTTSAEPLTSAPGAFALLVLPPPK